MGRPMGEASDRTGAAKSGDGAALPVVDPPELAAPVTPDRRGLTELAVGFGLALAGLVVFALLAANLYDQEAVALDTFVNPFLHSISSPALDAVMNAITALGSAPILVTVTVLAVVLLLSRGRRARALFVVTAIAGSVALNGTLKVAVERPRPVLAWSRVLPDFSFPSGHTMNALVLYLALALIIWVSFGSRIGVASFVAAIVLSLLVGFSRLYLGYHYLSDVVGGFAAGIAWLLVVALAFEIGPRTSLRRRRPDPARRSGVARRPAG